MPDQKLLARAEEIELKWKLMQIEEMEDRMKQREELKQRRAEDRRRQYEDFRKNEELIARRQAGCKHRKGGRDNRFWNGNSQDYSINKNTYPTGEEAIFCTRCQKTIWKPNKKLRQTDPKLYASMMEEWKIWSSYPTDNTPSGSKIFEVEDAVAA